MLPTLGIPDAERVASALCKASEEPYNEPVSLALLGIRLHDPFALCRGRA